MKKVNVLHQMGHNGIWNIDIYLENRIGDGFIFSPVNMNSKEKRIMMSNNLYKKGLFDPQIYNPKYTNKKVIDYDYYPSNLVDDRKIGDFNSWNEKSAELSVKLQNSENFKYIVIPTIYYESITSDTHKELYHSFISPYMKLIEKEKIKKPVLLTFLLKDIYLFDQTLKQEALNFITRDPRISGVYIVPDNLRITKRIKDAMYIKNMLDFLRTLKKAGMEVHLGYSDIESLIFTIAGVDSITFGSFENCRRFKLSRFCCEKVIMSSPIIRIFSDKLLNWIDNRILPSLKTRYKNYNKIFVNNKYLEKIDIEDNAFDFNQRDIYKHYFMVYYDMIKNLPDNLEERTTDILSKIRNAQDLYKKLEESGIIFSENDDSSHLTCWETGINLYLKGK
jgi:hypothetical protein